MKKNTFIIYDDVNKVEELIEIIEEKGSVDEIIILNPLLKDQLEKVYLNRIVDKANYYSNSEFKEFLRSLENSNKNCLLIQGNHVHSFWKNYSNQWFLEHYYPYFFFYTFLLLVVENIKTDNNIIVISNDVNIRFIIKFISKTKNNENLKYINVNSEGKETNEEIQLLTYLSRFIKSIVSPYSPKNIDERDVLLYIHSLNHFNQATPIINTLIEKKLSYSLIIKDRTKQKEIIALAKKNKYQYIEFNEMGIKNIKLHMIFDFFNIMFHKENIFDGVFQIYEVKIKEFALNIVKFDYEKEMIELFYKEIQPKIIITMNEIDPTCQLFINIAQQKDIFSIYLPHASISCVPTFREVASDLMLASGILDVNELSRFNNTSKLCLFGRPLYTEKLKEILMKKKQGAAINVLLTAQPWYSQLYLDYTINIAKLFNQQSDLNFSIKIHPAEMDPSRFKVNEVNIYHKEDIFKVINDNDIIITYYSNTAIEALLLDKIVICFSLGEFIPIMDYVHDNIVYNCKNYNDIETIIHRISDLGIEEFEGEDKEKRNEYIKDKIYINIDWKDDFDRIIQKELHRKEK